MFAPIPMAPPRELGHQVRYRTATHWSFSYNPADPVSYHNEIAYRAMDLTTLKTLYPAS